MVWFKRLSNVLLMGSGLSLGLVGFSIMVENYTLALIYGALAVAAFYYHRKCSEKHENELEVDAFLEGFKRGLKRGRD